RLVAHGAALPDGAKGDRHGLEVRLIVRDVHEPEDVFVVNRLAQAEQPQDHLEGEPAHDQDVRPQPFLAGNPGIVKIRVGVLALVNGDVGFLAEAGEALVAWSLPWNHVQDFSYSGGSPTSYVHGGRSLAKREPMD